jgi:hypothetical protein
MTRRKRKIRGTLPLVKRGLDLKKVVLLGRTLEEYERCFNLDLGHLSGQRLLDIAAGVSSFCAEATDLGLEVTSTDPIYHLSQEEILRLSGPDLDLVASVIGSLSVYRWGFYKSPQRMREFRERARRKFLAHYEVNRNQRYVPAALPCLPFPDRQFDLALVSYFLFVYEDQFTYDFHQRSLREIMRTTRGEARFYPLVTFEAERSSYLNRFKVDPDLADLSFEEVATDFEFLANSNSYLRVRHRSPAQQ